MHRKLKWKRILLYASRIRQFETRYSVILIIRMFCKDMHNGHSVSGQIGIQLGRTALKARTIIVGNQINARRSLERYHSISRHLPQNILLCNISVNQRKIQTPVKKQFRLLGFAIFRPAKVVLQWSLFWLIMWALGMTPNSLQSILSCFFNFPHKQTIKNRILQFSLSLYIQTNR